MTAPERFGDFLRDNAADFVDDPSGLAEILAGLGARPHLAHQAGLPIVLDSIADDMHRAECDAGCRLCHRRTHHEQESALHRATDTAREACALLAIDPDSTLTTTGGTA